MPEPTSDRSGPADDLKSPPTMPAIRPRPPILRALGAGQPPAEIEIRGATYRLVRVFKHDFWAATAHYAGDAGEVVCKFNRRQPLGLIPMRWVGRCLARNERRAMERLADVPNVPRWSGEVRVGGKVQSNAAAHEFIPGQPYSIDVKVDADYFTRLRQVLDVMHARRMAYVDLHKRENVLVGDDGLPYLIDFQVSFVPRDTWLSRTWPVRTWLRALQRADNYHYLKHLVRVHPERCDLGPKGIAGHRPLWIKVHRKIAGPIRAGRRRLLAGLHVRDRSGRVATELNAEEAFRLQAGGGPHAGRKPTSGAA